MQEVQAAALAHLNAHKPVALQQQPQSQQQQQEQSSDLTSSTSFPGAAGSPPTCSQPSAKGAEVTQKPTAGYSSRQHDVNANANAAGAVVASAAGDGHSSESNAPLATGEQPRLLDHMPVGVCCRCLS